MHEGFALVVLVVLVVATLLVLVDELPELPPADTHASNDEAWPLHDADVGVCPEQSRSVARDRHCSKFVCGAEQEGGTVFDHVWHADRHESTSGWQPCPQALAQTLSHAGVPSPHADIASVTTKEPATQNVVTTRPGERTGFSLPPWVIVGLFSGMWWSAAMPAQRAACPQTRRRMRARWAWPPAHERGRQS